MHFYEDKINVKMAQYTCTQYNGTPVPW